MFLPSGSQDDFGYTVSKRNKVFEAFRHVISKRGYQEIATPVVEFANNFTNQYVGLSLQNMVKWFNSEGEIEVLRPDWTMAIARSLAHKGNFPQKWAYQGSVFHQDIHGIEKRQVGIEIVNYPRFLGEAECILMARNYLEEIYIPNFMIELGHTGIFEELTNQLELGVEELTGLRAAMHDKRKDKIYKLVCDKGDIKIAHELVCLVDAYGSADTVISEYEKRWKNQENLLDKIHHLKKLVLMLNATGDVEVIVDLGRVKNLPYYSGILFRGFLKENGATCFSGGRYDKLFNQFGQRNNAVGLAFDVDVLAEEIQMDQSKEKICIIASDESIFFAENLRQHYKDSIVDVHYEIIDKDHYDRVLYILGTEGNYEVIEN